MKKINGLRFIVGNGCNYNCFYCHHEGFYDEKNIKINPDKLQMIYEFTKKHNIKNISITGGEPFMYWNNTFNILKQFNDISYKKTLNSNFSLVNNYIDELKKLNEIEFHVNLSSLNFCTHQRIADTNLLSKVLENLELIKYTQHKVCLNIPALHDFNDEELKKLYYYAKENGFTPRYLVLMAMTKKLKDNVMSIEEIINKFGKGKIIDKYSYGLYKVETEESTIDIVKCLCDDMECEICKENTFLHMTPNLDIKYCMKSNDIVKINFENEETIEESFIEANKRLELINK